MSKKEENDLEFLKSIVRAQRETIDHLSNQLNSSSDAHLRLLVSALASQLEGVLENVRTFSASLPKDYRSNLVEAMRLSKNLMEAERLLKDEFIRQMRE